MVSGLDAGFGVGIRVGRCLQLRHRRLQLGLFRRERSGGAERGCGRQVGRIAGRGGNNAGVERDHRLSPAGPARANLPLADHHHAHHGNRDQHDRDQGAAEFLLARFDEIAGRRYGMGQLVFLQMPTFSALHGPS